MSTQQRAIQSRQHNQDIAHKILLAIKDLRFGSVEVVIHDSKLVQIERMGKTASIPINHYHPSEVPMTIQRCCRI